MPRFATIDIGTNSVLLLVAERAADGRFTAVEELAEITRLGRGVDKAHRLAPEAIEETTRCLERFATRARALGVRQFAVTATSAARDAQNGAAFLEEVRRRAGLEVEIISGELEARLSYAAVHADFGREGGPPLIALDIGGGSTEFIYGERGRLGFRHSFDVGSVRLTERFVSAHPVPEADRARMRDHLRETFRTLPPAPAGARLVGVAGTVTTLYAVLHQVDPYEAARVHGEELGRDDLAALTTRLADLSLDERRKLKGLQPKRADVIAAGAHILLAAMEAVGAQRCTVSDRGLRWGLLAHRFGTDAG